MNNVDLVVSKTWLYKFAVAIYILISFCILSFLFMFKYPSNLNVDKFLIEKEQVFIKSDFQDLITIRKGDELYIKCSKGISIWKIDSILIDTSANYNLICNIVDKKTSNAIPFNNEKPKFSVKPKYFYQVLLQRY